MPITLQTLVVTMVGGLLGWRLGMAAVVAWLALGAAGLPVLAGGSGGLAKFAGPTAGYLLAFPVAAGLVGWLAERGWMRGLGRALAAMLLGNAVCLVMGAAWLAAVIGGPQALAAGLWPFLPGAVVKSLVAAGLVWRSRRRVERLA
ncbi:hypothetical protein GCM10011529_24920 [Polymorphobacter glacialis]|uniref:Biotin transporter n=1 Tax=Sandarakinorhabdus glacialis TaxID=1614636 RepID=A0A916ZXZ4_9SPHN|nr:biotin transporter BioY [Polymorphobacter glacialis]GGE17414.1 hypothetical protein GCM10011529_24920 [Polymorphobacter glacialis]